MRHISFRQIVEADLTVLMKDEAEFRQHVAETTGRGFGLAVAERLPPEWISRKLNGWRDAFEVAMSLYVGTPAEYIAMRDDCQKAGYKAGFEAGKRAMKEQVRARVDRAVSRLLDEKVTG